MAAQVVRAARKRHVRFATAESCTGGLVAHLITETPGAGDAYRGGWVVYADEGKTEDLGIPADLIAKHGAVSEAVAAALAAGAKQRAGVEYAVATTGIAGPTGGTPEKPVGLVWIGIATPNGAHAERHLFEDLDRHDTKRAFAERALQLLLRAVQTG